MSKTIINKARAEARDIAARDGITHQQALDAVARARGRAHWAAFKADPFDAPVAELDALLLHAWRRRASALRFDIGADGFVATVRNRSRTGICAGGDAERTTQLRAAVMTRFGIDIEGPEAEAATTIRLEGRDVPVTVNNCNRGGDHRLVVHMPDAVFGTAPLADLGIRDLGRWQELLTRPDHGLLLVLGRTMSGRSTTIDRSVRWAADAGVVAYGYDAESRDEAIAMSHHRIALLEVHGEGIHDVADAWADRHPGVRVLGGIEQRIAPSGDAGVLESLVRDRESSVRRVAEMGRADVLVAGAITDALRSIGGPELEEAVLTALAPDLGRLVDETLAMSADVRAEARRLRAA